MFSNLANLKKNLKLCSNCYNNLICDCNKTNCNSCNNNNNNNNNNNMKGGGNICETCESTGSITIQRIGNENLLEKYGYSINDNYENRIAALNRAIANNQKNKILKQINALRDLKKSNKKIYDKLNKDYEWIQRLKN